MAETEPRKQTDREGEIVQRALRDFGEDQAQRSLFAGQWEETAELILPTSRNTFFYGNYNWQGQKKTDRQIDASGGLALHRFCAIADSLCTPRNIKYDAIEAGGPDAAYIMKDRDTRLWFEDTTARLHYYRYAQTGNFSAQNYNNWQSLGAFGNATMYVDRFDDRMLPGTKGLRYRSVPLGETFYRENHQGAICQITRWFRRTAQQAVQQFGRKWLPQQLESALDNGSQWPYDFLHVVRPRDDGDYDPDRIDEKGKPFESYYICIAGSCLMQPEGGYRKFPYAPSRYDQTPGEVYGRGWAQIVLPALKTLNAQKSTYLKQAHRSADPVLLIQDDGMIDFNLRPGALNKGGVDSQGRELVKTLPTGNMQVAIEMMQQERSLIDDTALVSLFKVLTEHPNMTATQVIELVNEKGMLVAPTLGRQFGERAVMVERELDLLGEQRLLAPMPPRLREAGGEYRVVDKTPLALAARTGEAAGFVRTVESIKELVNITQDMSLLDPFDFPTAIPEIARIQNVPTRWMSDKKSQDDKAQRRAKAQAQQAQIQALPAQAAMLKAQATVAKNQPGVAPGQAFGGPQQQPAAA